MSVHAEYLDHLELELYLTVSGELLELPGGIDVPRRPFVWMRRGVSAFTRVNVVTGEAEEVDFPMLTPSGPVSIYPDLEHALTIEGQRLILAHRRDGVVREAPVFESSSSNQAWEGWTFTWDHTRLWFFGYGEDGLPLLYLFDALTLELLDTHIPVSTHEALWRTPQDARDDTLFRVTSWGDEDMIVRHGSFGDEPLLCLGHDADRPSHVMLMRALGGDRIERFVDRELYERIYWCSGEACALIDFDESTERIVYVDDCGCCNIRPIDFFERSRAGSDLTLDPRDFISEDGNGEVIVLPQLGDVESPYLYSNGAVSSPHHLFVLYEADGWEVSDTLVFVLDKRSLRPTGFFVTPVGFGLEAHAYGAGDALFLHTEPCVVARQGPGHVEFYRLVLASS